ncbi:EAL domain-containing protein [Proteiniclasticum sp. BAD-10]|uniref:EAL domain-containing protein n=1 Tax=Proteiniclasticum sediminis TaxID=2804028 RepID=A0A941CNK5_9CLOT|nr:EAL domain-containing protein [Proteiniclasticum sediminis]
MRKRRYKEISVSTFLVPFLAITLSFVVLSSLTVQAIRNYFEQHVVQDARGLALSYKSNLQKAVEAKEMTNSLLEDKLLMAGRTVLSTGRVMDNLELESFARMLDVDVIYYYDQTGTLLSASDSKNIGWKAPEGHPVDRFNRSGLEKHVEKIRKNTITHLYYKFSYFRRTDGTFVQVGILADKVVAFLTSFETERILLELDTLNGKRIVSFLGDDLHVSSSTDNTQVGLRITDPEAVKALKAGDEYHSYQKIRGESYLQVFVPVYVDGLKLGFLSVMESMTKNSEVVGGVTTMSLAAMVVVYLSVVFSMLSSFRKTRSLVQTAYFDSVSGLPNQAYLLEFLEEKILHGRNRKKAVVMVTVTGMKVINLTYGLEEADRIIRNIGAHLKLQEKENLRFFRFSASQFIVYLEGYRDKDELLSQLFEIQLRGLGYLQDKSWEHELSFQMGIVELTGHSSSADHLLKDALLALDQAKRNHDQLYAFFDEAMEKQLERENQVEKEIRNALFGHKLAQLHLHYQPQVELSTGRIIAFEALARMESEKLGAISPQEFIAIAEKKGLIIDLGYAVTALACRFIQSLDDAGYGEVRVGINVSVMQLLRDDFLGKTLEVIKDYGVECWRLKLEITESILMENYARINEKLAQIRQLGMQVELDDFGTGYSSFARLEELAIDALKIDKSFIDRIADGRKSSLILADLISMAHKQGLVVVAEGVETPLQEEYLRENCCDYLQGYVYSRPLPEAEALALLDKTGLKEKWKMDA